MTIREVRQERDREGEENELEGKVEEECHGEAEQNEGHRVEGKVERRMEELYKEGKERLWRL